MKRSARTRISLKAWEGWAQEKLDALARQTVYEMAETVVELTPVDVGFLRGSWQPSIGATGKVKDGAGDDPSGAAAMVEIAAIVSQMEAGDRFHMLNNAAYAMRMEFGFTGEDALGRYYDQPGRFFVADTVARWRSTVSRVALELGMVRK